ncbi:hypothetical protein [Methanosarcina mazei]|jgi:hypothetical protein|uniref:Uncharacterized protein n=2 Tax=Methanosarcina mazei TaxID=2209 RepID=A0A0F8IPA5_METMZ|nr:hypothetical protein [Methanosarcina mazei]AKB72054.1 hypothetical protein MSMAC_2164 [Methanosarcina mazei C16]KKG11119.1 hypothetical protein DU34_02940 [Methanosarcina mazei]KKG30446.1 hypothetical protein DU49_00065 [Methanosarcina mazei]KKG41477.1 hypothetical protein DU41_01250 [Methanosarcina mazei]KKG41698.1 hypothetical protein DU35_03135 [Methanosarcina mazei]
MERRQMLRILIPVFTVIAMTVLAQVVSQKLGEAVTKNGVHDYPLITISLIGFFLFGFFTYWILIKSGI